MTKAVAPAAGSISYVAQALSMQPLRSKEEVQSPFSAFEGACANARFRGRHPPANLAIVQEGGTSERREVHNVGGSRLLYLRIALVVFGLVFIFGIYPLTVVWPGGWSWGHGHSHYLMMIIGVYATLGVFLLLASRDPDANKSLI